MSTLPVRSPLPKSVPSTRSAPAISASSVAATARAAVVVRVHRELDRVAARDVAREPLDAIGVHVRRRHLDGGGQVQDQATRGRRLEDVHHGLADLERVVELGAGERLGRVLEAHVASETLGVLAAPLGALHGDALDALAIEAEDDAALQLGDRVVEMDDRARRALDRLERALDQVLARLCQHDDREVVGNQLLLDQQAREVEVGLGGRGEADLDLAEPEAHEQVPHAALARAVHRVHERLVAVAQVDGHPVRRVLDHAVGPRPVRQVDGRVVRVFAVRHRHRRLLAREGFGVGRTSPVYLGCVCASRAARGPLPLPLPGKERDEAEKKGVASHAGGNPAEARIEHGDGNLGHVDGMVLAPATEVN